MRWHFASIKKIWGHSAAARPHAPPKLSHTLVRTQNKTGRMLHVISSSTFQYLKYGYEKALHFLHTYSLHFDDMETIFQNFFFLITRNTIRGALVRRPDGGVVS